MQKQHESNPVVIITVTAVLSLIILVGAAVLFLTFLVPRYGLSLDDLHLILTRLLPMSIGLTLVLLALVIVGKPVTYTPDESDMLEKDEYVAPLFILPDEHESLIIKRFPHYSSIESTTAGIVAEPEVSPYQDLPVEPFEPSLAVPPHQDIPVEPSLAEPQLTRPTVSDEMAQRLSKSVTFEAYPHAIEPHSTAALLLEPIAQSNIDDKLPATYLQLLDDNFENRLEVEIEAAIEHDYQLCVAAIHCNEDATEFHQELAVFGLVYPQDQNTTFLILPFYSATQSQRLLTSLMGEMKKEYPHWQLSVGTTQKGSPSFDVDQALKEISTANSFASQRDGFTLIAYDDALQNESNL